MSKPPPSFGDKYSNLSTSLETKLRHQGLLWSGALVLVESMIRPRQTFKISPCYKDKIFTLCPCQKDIIGLAYPAWRYIPSCRKS
jgi:hypothetical protein